LSSIICFDGDSPQLLAQAGALRADVMLDPSNDWRANDPWHTQMASFRAIEEGFSLIRQTSTGLSAAYDYQGRRLAAMDHYMTTDYAMVSHVPTPGRAHGLLAARGLVCMVLLGRTCFTDGPVVASKACPTPNVTIFDRPADLSSGQADEVQA
jgi:apolipoprotein N-acyltransferase